MPPRCAAGADPAHDSEGGCALSSTAIALVIILALYLPIVGYLYGRQGRWAGAAGWALLVVSVAGFGTGVSRSFPWGGLVFLAAALFGLMLVVFDVAVRARSR
ncbi:hypothetical protein [Sphaerobacter thermophilus]|uniref:hypothetical protein n=1 Tax=Sphaerobacter thermophilus TaxID=2057 RepID=UPI000DB88530|nr:MAG: hypothetical protein DIU58_03380 [Sphaerobacter thermophilus]